MDTVKIENISKKYIPEVVKIWNESFSGLYMEPKISKQSLIKKTYESVQFDESASFIAFNNSKMVGFVISFADKQFENDSYWHMAVSGWIGAMAVSEPYRKQQIGEQLLKSADEVHKSKGRPIIFTGGGEGIDSFFPGIEDTMINASDFFKKMVMDLCAEHVLLKQI
ncbi:MAG: hypothetical protein A2252_06895 [Elusimicrobia bacterium RIFOXYA2_FULL_39_19]|nr:MAG: hypothetical protein A2252_06895 [Elusimicrobia bacterium RIFOXYA2_FULL_39_19]